VPVCFVRLNTPFFIAPQRRTHLRCNDPSRKQTVKVKESKARKQESKRPLSRVSVPRSRPVVIEAHRTARAGSTGGSSPCSPGQAARLRVAPVPRPSGRAVDPALGCRSSRPHDGARPGNRHLTRTGPVRNAVLRTAFSQPASKQARTRGLFQGSDGKERQSIVITGIQSQ